MFCFCGVREEQNEISAVQSQKQIITSLQPNMKSMNGELQSPYSNCNKFHQEEFIRTSDSLKEYDDFISEYRGSRSGYFQAEFAEIQEEAKTSEEKLRLIHQGDGLLAKIVSINQATQTYNDTFYSFILKVLHETKRHYDITPQHEVQFVKHLVPHFITEQTIRRVKNDRLLITHDPTGSFLLKHLISNHVHYISESKTYQPILNNAIRILGCEDKITYIAKSDITDKLDTVIINLLNLNDTPLSLILQEYLTLAHDIIIVISPKIEYQQLMSQLRYGIKNSHQSHIHCSIEIQNIYNKSQLIGRIIYYGEVSNITQNQQLSFLYNCIPKTIKKTLKYKSFLKDLRGKLGIMKLVDLFSLYGLIQDNSELAFDRFYQQVSNQYLANVKSSRFLNEQVQSNKSSTESESEDAVPLLKVNSSVLQDTKLQSKSLSTNYVKQEYVHFHSQNCKTKFTQNK